ncbi:FKBP-type peptidyl-prolyl cis-trans isomerase [Fulvivirga lutea]|uniref:Peptidyl-prolyl cis-trans isomerase n=1 Tax=Fulvivirga lutea TaxID=2810512 RepID=A0A974WFI8_9BACT|nr:FKBP-type peptidyl-prolyl cis-trans isomerase [Fulvivirga lutea]QSE97528.1 FKBP-type peptidyl-prolyl cis-trans isomerase [Fulvivirga lutea]
MRKLLILGAILSLFGCVEEPEPPVVVSYQEQLAIDVELIDNYLSSNGLQAEQTTSGLRYIIHEEGSGEVAKARQKVKVDYTGSLLNGNIFDTSYKDIAVQNNIYDSRREPYGPIQFTLGIGQVISGWDEGISLLNEGTKATLYIPSGLGYGRSAVSASIPANSILIFEVDLVEIVQ